MAAVSDAGGREMKKVLFICVQNAGRSQMAEALFNALAGGRAVAASAGTRPAERVHPEVVQAMSEVGIDLSGSKPKMLTEKMVAEADRVITMGCGADEACPVTFTPAEDWGIEDPAGQSLDKVRVIRDQIRARVEGLLRDI